MQRFRENKWVRRYRSDAVFRAEASLYAGLAVNLLYVAVKAIGGWAFHSQWLGALAAYYLLLSLMRFALLRYVVYNPIGEKLRGEWRRYRLCALLLLLLMSQALAVIVFMMVRRSNGFTYPGMLIYAAALYAFYAVISAVVNMVRFRRYNSPVLSAARAVNLVAAMVSMLALETGLLAQFAEPGQERFCLLMISLSGAAVCAVVVAMAVYMIRRANLALKLKE